MASASTRVSFVRLPLSIRATKRSERTPTCSLSPPSSVQTRDIAISALPGLRLFIAEAKEKDLTPTQGVVLLSDIHGYGDPHTRFVAELFASSGLPTVVPDLFDGNPWQTTWNRTNYETWRASIDMARVDDAVRVAAQELSASCGVEKFSLLGFCFGGGRLMDELGKGSDGLSPQAAVAFYPTSKLCVYCASAPTIATNVQARKSSRVGVRRVRCGPSWKACQEPADGRDRRQRPACAGGRVRRAACGPRRERGAGRMRDPDVRGRRACLCAPAGIGAGFGGRASKSARRDQLGEKIWVESSKAPRALAVSAAIPCTTRLGRQWFSPCNSIRTSRLQSP